MVNTMAKRTDANQREIVDALRQAGATVYCAHAVGHGFPDLVVGFREQNYLLEVKSEQNALTDDQLTFFAGWRGQVTVIRSTTEALRAIGAME
jgi:hypothetical protein